MSRFWDLFIACLTGAGAMFLAIAVIGLVAWGLFNIGGLLVAWAADAFENRSRR